MISLHRYWQKFLHNSTIWDLFVAKLVAQYIFKTKSNSLFFSVRSHSNLKEFVGSDWAGCHDRWQWTCVIIVILNGTLIFSFEMKISGSVTFSRGGSYRLVFKLKTHPLATKVVFEALQPCKSWRARGFSNLFLHGKHRINLNNH